jgi:putative inorganic carbon (hco3(-)) transporter
LTQRELVTLRGLEVARAVLLAAFVVGLAVSISLSQIALTGLLIWVLLARWQGMLGPLRWPLWPPIAAFTAWSVVAALASTRPLESLVESKHLLTLGTVLIIANVLPDAATARKVASWLLLAVALAAAASLVQVAACPDQEVRPHATTLVGKFMRKCWRARGFYSIYMTLAGVLAMTVTAALPPLSRVGAHTRWLLPAWIVSLTALALTYVRGAWLGLGAGVLVVVAGLGRRGLAAAGVMLALAVALAAGLPEVRARVASIVDPANDTARDRMAMLEVGLRLTGRHPIVGIGPGQLKHIYAQEAPPEAMRRATSHVHNTPLQIALERGLPGLAMWLWIFVAFFRRAGTILVRLPAEPPGDRALVLGSLAALATFMVAGLFEFNFGDTEVLLVATTLMALPFVVAAGRVSADPCQPA